ncbi:MAG: 50S ribosomal protein L36 [Patescibacteria group bacterium]
MRVKASVKKICAKCMTVRRNGAVRIVCKSVKKHNQRQG